MNRAIIIGNLVNEPDVRTTGNGLSITTFTVAAGRRFKQEGGQEADFIQVVTWRALADNCGKYLNKGSKVGVVGAIQTRYYDDSNGIRRYITEIIADEVEFLTSKENQAGGNREEINGFTDDKLAGALSDFEPMDDADLPF